MTQCLFGSEVVQSFLNAAIAIRREIVIVEQLRRLIAVLKRHWAWLKWPVAVALMAFLLYQHRGGFRQLIERETEVDFFLVEAANSPSDTDDAFRNWRNERRRHGFPATPEDDVLRVAVADPHDLNEATFVVVTSDHPLAQSRRVQSKEEKAAQSTCFDAGITAIHPLTEEILPVWICDEFLAESSSRAVLGIPSTNKRDRSFAESHGIPLEPDRIWEKGESTVSEQLASDGTGRMRSIRWGFLLLALLICTAAILSTFVRWYLLVWGLDFEFKLADALRIGLIGYLFNYVAPGSVGGDLVKAVMIAREQRARRAVAVATVFLDRVLGLLALFIVGGIVVLFPTPLTEAPEFRTISIAFWVGGGAGLLGLAIMMHPRTPRNRWVQRLTKLPIVGHPIGDLINAVLLYQSRRRVLVAAVAISLLGHLGILSTFYFCALALHPPETVPSYVAHLQFIPAAEIVGVFVPLPGGIGALEEAVNYFYLMAGAPPDHGFLTAIAFRGLTIVIAAVGGGYYLTRRKEISRALEDCAEPAREPVQAAT